MANVVLSIGGSVLVPGKDDPSYIKALVAVLRKISSRHKLFVVTGGGRISRYYIETGRELRIPEHILDEFGILATRMNARILSATLTGLANYIPPETVEGAASLAESHKIVIMGGTTPGWTTDYVAASLAQIVKAARLVNATSVDGVYTADPKRNKKAKRLENITYERLIELSGKGHTRAGPNIVFDPVAARLIAKARIPLHVVDGRDLTALNNSLEGKPFRGTRVGEE